MIKKISSHKIKKWFEPMFFSGFFCGFERCGFAAFPNFRVGTSSPPQAAKCVRTNSRILHHVGKVKEFWFGPPPPGVIFFFNFWGKNKKGVCFFGGRKFFNP